MSKDDLNKYEKAYIRSQLRKKKKETTTVEESRSFSERVQSFFSLSKAKKMTSRYLDELSHQSRAMQHDYKDEPSREVPDHYSVGTMLNPKTIARTMKKNILKQKKNNKGLIMNILFLIGTVFLIGIVIIGIWFATLEIPDVTNFEQRKISNSTKIYDRTGEIILYDIHENIQRSVVEFENINQYAKDAIIAIEDHSFYEHKGVVVSSTLRGVTQTVLSKLGLSSAGTAGGSTLTQQVVKNTLLNSRQLISRKMKEWILAYKIEQRLTKDQILEIYLNEAPYGGTIYGIEEASRIFFGTNAAELTLGQAAYLAAIPNLPTFYSPYGPNKDKLDERQQTVLREMKRYGFITDEEYRLALEEEVEFLSQEENRVKALHFVQYIRAYLEEEYGNDLVENGGLKVVTTLDYKLQEKAEEIIKQHIEEVEEEFNASNAALVAIESSTGQILTMVGSRDYFDEDIDGNYNVAIAERQPGSSFKPLAYAQAFEEGYLPDTVVFDTRTQFSANCSASNFTSANGCYSPDNYDSEFTGPLSLRNALAQSRNIPAVKVLYLAGIADTMRLAQEMGINTLTRSPASYGLGLVLGGGEVSLLELTGAYTVFANDGEFNKPVGILSIEDADGNVLEEYQSNEKRVLSQNSARMISSILSDNVARSPLFGSQSFLYFGGRSVAGKTGTTNDNRDAWLVGFSPDVAVGVWTGNNDNTPMRKGSSISGKPWRSFMNEVLKEYSASSFGEYSLPENLNELPPIIRGQWQGGDQQQVTIDSRDGSVANDSTPEEYREEVVRFEPHTILHWIDKNNPLQTYISTSDPQYENWEASVQAYAQQNFQQQYQQNQSMFGDGTTTSPEDVSIEITGMENGTTYQQDDEERITVGFDGIDMENILSVEFFINDVAVGSDSTQPFTYTLEFATMEWEDMQNSFKAVAQAENNMTFEHTLFFYVDGVTESEE